MDKEIKYVTFEFEDGTKKILKGDELLQWQVLCLMKSDYLLPGGPDHVLAEGHGGLVKGWIPEKATHGRIWKKVQIKEE